MENVVCEGFENIKPMVTEEDAFTDEEILAVTAKYRTLFRRQ